VPQVSNDYLVNAAEHGTFPKWVAENAPSLRGMSLVVGQGRNLYYDPDRLYVILKLAPEARTYQVAIGWRDYTDRGNGNREKFTSLTR
jgi:hypothetical protein